MTYSKYRHKFRNESSLRHQYRIAEQCNWKSTGAEDYIYFKNEIMFLKRRIKI